MKRKPGKVPEFKSNSAANSRDVPYQSLIKVWLQEKLGEQRPGVRPG